MELLKYRYNGDSEVHMPTFGLLVQPGEVVEVKSPINNPLFELVEGSVEETQPEEVVEEDNYISEVPDEEQEEE